MSTTSTVLGNVPLEYTDPATGKQVSIPLSALKFTNGQLKVDTPGTWPNPSNPPSPTPPYIKLPDFVNSMLTNLAQQGVIIPAPTPSPKPAMVVTAQDPGSAGNNIVLTFALTTPPNLDPTQVKFSMTVTETESYKKLTLTSGKPNYIETVLGSDTVTSPTPGLAYVIHASLGAAGTPALPSPATFKVTNPPSPKARLDVKSTDAVPKLLFTLEAKKAGKDGEFTSVFSVGANADDASLFDLTIQWTRQVTNLTLANVATNTGPLGYEVAVAAPFSGIFSIPQANSVQLSGGTDGFSPTAASAIVFAGQ